ncbi:MAG TPA: alpha/beta fold hydrolase [Gemmatimonadaceae bacterium]|nr:alpha/beta fold hydrolase [Gemmatimonadaceae bacterium]
MRAPIAVLTAASLFCAMTVAPTAAQGQQLAPNAGGAAGGRVAGTWEGLLSTGATKLRLELLVRDSAGALTGNMRSLDQGGATASAHVAAAGDSLTVDVPDWHIGYTGVLASSGDSLHGTFRQGGTSMPLAFGRSSAPVSAERPQDPKPPFPYATSDVTVESVPGVRLAGTLIMPPGRGPFPAVVFVTGSGPQDRDEALMGHRPFLVIADYLARHGMASLRYDDRGVAKSTGSFDKATSADFSQDAEAAVHYLMHVKGVASNHVGILGHSEGGVIGPMVAARSRDVAFLVLMSGPGVPGDSILLLQGRAIAVAMGASEDVAATGTKNQRVLLEAVAQSSDSVDAAARLAKAKDSILTAVPSDRRAAAEAQIDQGTTQLLSPWFRYFVRYDPRPALRRVHVPVLALGGSLDLQVPARENLAAIDTALRAGGNRDYRVEELPKLNHLFQTATTGAPSEYATIEQTVAPAALDAIATWINAHFRAP